MSLCDHPKQADGRCLTCERIDHRPFRAYRIAPDLFTTPMVWPLYNRTTKQWVYP